MPVLQHQAEFRLNPALVLVVVAVAASAVLYDESVCVCVCVCWRSAGIGRTGVLIAMETAICLIEANQPVSLPDIVCQMRDQRPMLIQTAVSH